MPNHPNEASDASTFVTWDLDLAGYLTASGHPYIAVIPPNAGTNRTAFSFARTPELERAHEAWVLGKLVSISPRLIAEHKQRLFRIARDLGGAR